MDLKGYRDTIDGIDRQILDLFVRRMAVSAEIGALKKEMGLAVYDAARESEKLESVARLAPEELRGYAKELWNVLFDLSRRFQERADGRLDGARDTGGRSGGTAGGAR